MQALRAHVYRSTRLRVGAQLVVCLIGQGRHLAAEESFGLVVKPVSCETGLKHHVCLATLCAIT